MSMTLPTLKDLKALENLPSLEWELMEQLDDDDTVFAEAQKHFGTDKLYESTTDDSDIADLFRGLCTGLYYVVTDSDVQIEAGTFRGYPVMVYQIMDRLGFAAGLVVAVR